MHNAAEPAHARCGFADVLDALQRVGGVGAAKDAGSEHDSEGVGRHSVCVLLQHDPETPQKEGAVNPEVDPHRA